jgi:hypothetical protein
MITHCPSRMTDSTTANTAITSMVEPGTELAIIWGLSLGTEFAVYA